MTRRVRALLAVLFLVPAVLTSCSSGARTPAPAPVPIPVRSGPPPGPPLLFLGNKSIAPVVYLDGDRPAGLAVDLVTALAGRLSRPVEVRVTDWQAAQQAVAQGRADALIQINVTEARKKLYDFSDPFLESHFAIFVRSGDVGISGVSGLAGRRVGVEAAGLPRQILGTDPRIRLVVVPGFLEGFTQVRDGALDAVVVDYRVGSYVLAQNGIRDIKVTGAPIETSYSRIAVRKGNTALLQEINAALRAIKSDGTYQRILDTWAPTEAVFETEAQIRERVYRTVAIGLLILLLVMIAWAASIARQLRRRRATEEESRRRYATLRGIIDSFGAPIFSVDRQYRYTSFNQSHADTMAALYGTRVELDRVLLDCFTVESDREEARRNLDRALAGELTVEEAYSGEEGASRRCFRVSHSPIRNEAADVIGVAVLVQDITDRRRAEDEVRELNQELEQRVRDRTRQLEASKQERDLAFRELQLAHARVLQQEKMASIGQLAAGIAHEINTPTQFLGDNLAFLEQCLPELMHALESGSGVAGACPAEGPAGEGSAGEACGGDGAAAQDHGGVEVRAVGGDGRPEELDLSFVTEEIPRALQESRAGVQRIASIVAAMKDFAYRGSDRPEAADLARLIATATEMSRNEWKLVAQLEVTVEPDAAVLTCYRDRLGQVLLNLLVNCAHAIADAQRPPGEGRIRVHARRDGDWIEILVQDNGCGIPADVRPRIFEPFFTTKAVGRGTGQGLAIVHDLVVNVHQGQIQVDSEVGVGTTVTVRLPFEGPQEPDRSAAVD